MPDRGDDLFVLVMAGGRGARFWPLSRKARPKQCLTLGDGPSLLRRTVDRVLPIVPPERVLVVTSQPVETAVREQLPDLPAENILVEPEGRNTAPAIGWGALQIGRRSHGRRAVMAVLPADQLIEREDELRDALLDCAEAARNTNALVTIGLTPTRPETGFGYLEVGGELGRWGDRAFLRVERFKEKPDLPTARRYVDGGHHLWNAGMFVFTVEAIRDAFRSYMPRTWAELENLRHSPERLAEIYPRLEAISIDYGVMERARHLLTVSADLGWSDVGSWDAVDELVPEHDHVGRARARPVGGLDAHHNVVHAPGKVVALVGVSDLVVVDTGDALLVCRRDQAQRVREVTDLLGDAGFDDLL